MHKGTLLILPAILSPKASAGEFESAIEYVQVNTDLSAAIASLSQNPANQPACATDSRMTVDLTTDSDKAIYSLLLTAKSTGGTVYGKGTDTCMHVSDMESVRYIRLL